MKTKSGAIIVDATPIVIGHVLATNPTGFWVKRNKNVPTILPSLANARYSNEPIFRIVFHGPVHEFSMNRYSPATQKFACSEFGIDMQKAVQYFTLQLGEIKQS